MEIAASALIVWCIQGECKGGECVVNASNVGVFFPRDKRMVVEAAAAPVEYRFLAIDGDDALADCIAAGLWEGLTGKAEPSAELFERIARHLSGNSPAGIIAADIAARELLLHTAQQVRENAPDRIAHEAQHRMNWRCTDPEFSIAVLQKEMGISRSSLTTHFKKATGESPLAYLTGIRLRLAKALLTEAKKNIATVARESGFGCPVYFSQIITKHTGLSPRAYRRKVAAQQ
jgi:AraC-like DNA-binding protein